MNKQTLTALVLLNLVLLVGLAVVTLTPQSAGDQLRGRGEYTMISGKTKARSNANVVWLADLSSGKLAALVYESGNERLTDIGRFDFSRDLEAGGNSR